MQKSIGIALGLGALTFIICRYVFLPLEQSSLMNALLTGGPIGVLFGSARMAQTASGKANLPALFGFGAVAVGAVIGGFLFFHRVPHDVALETVTTSGLEIDLPDWKETKRIDLGATGVVIREDGSRRRVHIEWSSYSETMPREEFAMVMKRSMMSNIDPVMKEVTVSGVDTWIALQATDKPLNAATSNFRCEPGGHAVTVLTAMYEPMESVETLHRRILASLTCRIPPAKRDITARFDPPEGFELGPDEGDGLITWNRGNDSLVIPGPIPNLEIAEKMAQIKPVRDAILESFMTGARELPGPTSRVVDGFRRGYWVYEGTVEGETMRVMLSGFPCPDLNVSFMTMYSDPRDQAEASAVLDRVHCPR